MIGATPPIHPGEILREEFLIPMGLSAIGLAKALHLPRSRIERICREETAVTADTALRLGKFFGTTPRFWLNLQTNYDLAVTAGSIQGLDDIHPTQYPNQQNERHSTRGDRSV